MIIGRFYRKKLEKADGNKGIKFGNWFHNIHDNFAAVSLDPFDIPLTADIETLEAAFTGLTANPAAAQGRDTGVEASVALFLLLLRGRLLLVLHLSLRSVILGSRRAHGLACC